MYKLIIDGVSFDIPIIELKRTADVLDKVAERTEDGDLYREVIGTYLNYTCAFGFSTTTMSEYDKLFDMLIKPVPYHDITLPINNKYKTFKGYVSSVSDSVGRVTVDGTEFQGLTCKFTAKIPTIKG